LHKKDGTRAEWEYPFAVAGINISFMLVQMLDLQSGIRTEKQKYHAKYSFFFWFINEFVFMVAGSPTSLASVRFLELLGEDEMAFDNLFCVAFQMMDVQWLSKRASYMEFNVKIIKPSIIFFTILV
jgi:ELMO domain-containing protein